MSAIKKLFWNCWYLIWSCVPGCGQMCLGYMKRGISQTIIFSVLAFIAVFLEMGVLTVLILPLWAYSFFDSFNLRRQLRDGAPPEDEFMFGLSEMDSRKLTLILQRRHGAHRRPGHLVHQGAQGLQGQRPGPRAPLHAPRGPAQAPQDEVHPLD